MDPFPFQQKTTFGNLRLRFNPAAKHQEFLQNSRRPRINPPPNDIQNIPIHKIRLPKNLHPQNRSRAYNHIPSPKLQYPFFNPKIQISSAGVARSFPQSRALSLHNFREFALFLSFHRIVQIGRIYWFNPYYFGTKVFRRSKPFNGTIIINRRPQTNTRTKSANAEPVAQIFGVRLFPLK